MVAVLVACKHEAPANAPTGTGSGPGAGLTFRKQTWERIPVAVKLPEAEHADLDAERDTIVAASPSEITLDGVAVVALAGGRVAPEDVEANAWGAAIPKLRKALEARHADAAHVLLAVDHTLSTELVAELAGSVANGSRRTDVALALSTPNGVRAIVVVAHGHTAGKRVVAPTSDAREVIAPWALSVDQLVAIATALPADGHVFLDWNNVDDAKATDADDAAAQAAGLFSAEVPGSGAEGDMTKRKPGADLGQQLGSAGLRDVHVGSKPSH